MAQLTKAKGRRFSPPGPADMLDMPVLNAVAIYQGSAIGESSSAGDVRQLVAGDNFYGFCIHDNADNTGGAVGDINCRIQTRGIVKRVTITGASTIADVNDKVYMSDGDVFTKTSTSNSLIGKIVHFNSDDSTFDIYFESTLYRVGSTSAIT